MKSELVFVAEMFVWRVTLIRKQDFISSVNSFFADHLIENYLLLWDFKWKVWSNLLFQDLISLPPKISCCDIVLKFFEPKPDDIDPTANE